MIDIPIDEKKKSEFQERLVNLFLRLNGYLQSGFIPHSEEWGNAGTDVDRIAVKFPLHSQKTRKVSFSTALDVPDESIDIIIAEVKNTSLTFNKSISKKDKRAELNWSQILNWIGLFKEDKITELTAQLIEIVNKQCENENGSFPKVEHTNQFGKITIRPILFSIGKEKTDGSTKKWINGEEILSYLWKCFCPEINREECSTRYPFTLWGTEYNDIVEYIKARHKSGFEIGTLEEMYSELIK